MKASGHGRRTAAAPTVQTVLEGDFVIHWGRIGSRAGVWYISKGTFINVVWYAVNVIWESSKKKRKTQHPHKEMRENTSMENIKTWEDCIAEA